MSEPAEIRDRTVGEYVRLARADLEYAEIGVRAAAEPVLIGFHAQQAVEKLLKAVLVTLGVDPGDTHDLGRLLERVRLLDRALADALGSVGRLTPYAVFHRYPPRLPGSSPVSIANRCGRISIWHALPVRCSRARSISGSSYDTER